MGDSWEEIVKDPIALDLQVILSGGFYGFEAGKLNCLPSLFGTDDRPASASEIREILRPLLMADDPGKQPSDKDLSLNSRLNLTLFRVDGASKPKSRKGAQELAGRLQRPDSPLGADGVRKRPNKGQPRGGLEWKHLIEVRAEILRWAHSEGKADPPPLDGTRQKDNITASSDDPGPSNRATNQSGSPYPEDKDDLDQPLLARASVKDCLDQLAEVDGITIFVGAGASADMGIPLHQELMPSVVEELAARDTSLGTDNTGDTSKAIGDALTILSNVSPTYLGSIARELASVDRASSADGVLREALKLETTDAASQPGGFSARAITALAFYLKAAGKTVTVITTNYDDLLEKEGQYKLYQHVDELSKYKFDAITWPAVAGGASAAKEFFETHHVSKADADAESLEDEGWSLCARDDTHVALFYANGTLKIDQHVIVGELDFLRPDDPSDSARFEVREALIQHALKTTTCLFVGSSVTDPDMLRFLASIRDSGQKHFAILLAPPMEIPPSKSMDKAEQMLEQAEAAYKVARKLVARRFHHLGVQPITADFASQVPQLLREVGLKAGQEIVHERAYEDYGERLEHWWGVWHKYLGFSNSAKGVPDEQRNVLMQEVWRSMLAELRDDVVPKFFREERVVATTDSLKVELWLRNIRPRELKYPPIDEVRSLFLWASSEGLLLDGKQAVWGPISIKTHSHFLAQRVFREGRTLVGPTDAPRGPWQYIVGTPLVLHKAPWHHLTVGVLTVFSDVERPKDKDLRAGTKLKRTKKTQGKLFAAVDPDGYMAKEPSEKRPTGALDAGVGKVNYTKAERFEDVVKEQLNDILGSETPLLAFGARLSEAQQRLGLEAPEELRRIDQQEYEDWLDWLDQQSEQ